MLHLRRGIGSVLLLLGVFWGGRESDHGWSAFWEHWWCPLPLVMVVGGVAVLLVRRRSPRPGL